MAKIKKIQIIRIKSLPDIKKELGMKFRKKIRLRDARCNGWANCCSCGKAIQYGTGNYQAGHYIPVGVSSYLAYNNRNCHAQCNSCNSFKRGNPLEYRKFMNETYGEEIEREMWNNRKNRVVRSREWYAERIKKEEYLISQLKIEKGLR